MDWFLLFIGDKKMRKQPTLTVTILGPSQSGKSALLKKLKHQPLSTEYEPTIGIDYGFIYKNNRTIKINDISGKENFKEVRKTIINTTHYHFLIVVNSPFSEDIKKSLDEITAIYPNKKTRPPINLVINTKTNVPINIQDIDENLRNEFGSITVGSVLNEKDLTRIVNRIVPSPFLLQNHINKICKKIGLPGNNPYKPKKLMEYLVKNFHISEMEMKVTELFQNNEIKNLFNQQFLDYQIENAHQILQWQRELERKNLEKNLERIDLAFIALSPQQKRKLFYVDENVILHRQFLENLVAAKTPHELSDTINNFPTSQWEKESPTLLFNAKTAKNPSGKIALDPLLQPKFSKQSGDFKTQLRQDIRKHVVELELQKPHFQKAFIKNIKNLIENVTWSVLRGTKIKVGDIEKRVPSHVADIYSKCLIAERQGNWNDVFNYIMKTGAKAAEKHWYNPRLFRSEKTQQFYQKFEEDLKTLNKTQLSHS